MTRTLTLTLPYPPSVNSIWRAVGSRVLLSARGRAWREAAVESLAGQVGERFLAGERLAVHVQMFPPDARRRDVDGVLKAPLDALTHGGVYSDDSQIDQLSVTRGPKRPGGALIVTIQEIDHAQ